MLKTYTFHVSGMHCKSCVFLTEGELQDLPQVTKAKTSLRKHSVEVTGDFGEEDPAAVARLLSETLRPHGYELSVEKKQENTARWSEFRYAAPLAAAFILLFILMQKLGIVNWVSTGEVSYGAAFLIGIVASLSTCMAVVGGLALSVSATFAKEGDKIKPQALFHGGRLFAFFLFGGIIGAIGANFTLGTTGIFIMSVLVGAVMLILGLNLLDVFPWAKRLQPAMPRFLTRRALRMRELNHEITPFLLGIATFFLPCGFTQAMQIYTLSTESFMAGALTLTVYALGTLPVLALLSFSSLSIHGHRHAGIFFKTAGLVVIAFAFFNLINALVVLGVISPVFNF